MSNHPSIEDIRSWIARDQDAFDRQNAWLTDLQNTSASQLSPSHRTMLSHWDRSTIKDCNRHLFILEAIESPTIEERELMQQLNRLVVLGDHMVDRMIAVQEELEVKLGKVDMTAEPALADKTKESVEEVTKKPAKLTLAPQPAKVSGAAPPKPSDSEVEGTINRPASAPPTSNEPANSEMPTKNAKRSDSVDDNALESRIAMEDQSCDPSELYMKLGVSPDISFADLKKFIRKSSIRMHPDKNLDDPDASSKFANFTAATSVFETEERRRAFDALGSDKATHDLVTRFRNLKMA